MEKNSTFRKIFASTYARLISFAVLFAVITSSDLFAQGTIIDNGSPNRWVLHNPNDSRKSLFLAPSNSSGGWDWSKGTTFDDNGDVLISGRVGVGTTNIASGLRMRVNGDFAANTVYGSIRSSSIRVTTPEGADFVFEEDYALPSLADVESYIDIHNHLPEIASADEMKAEGLELGTFTIKLLQKIEELTLYTIEQEKRIQGLEKKQSASQSSVQEKQYSPSN